MDSRWIVYGMPDLFSKLAWRYTIRSTPNFGSFRAAKMTPFWDPNFPFRVVNWRPHFSKPIGSPYLTPGCTLRYESQVLPPTLWVIGLTLAGRATRGNDANFGDFGIMTPLDSSPLP